MTEMTPEMQERFLALGDFMEWVDPEGYADVIAPGLDRTTWPDGSAS